MEIILILLSAVLPALCLLFFVYWQDKYKKEPLKLLWKGFGYGAVLAVLIVVIIGEVIYMVFSPAPTVFGNIMDSLIGAAIPEELAKFFLLWLLLRKNKYYDEYFDGIVYAASIGLGFAATENIKYLFEAYIDGEWLITGIHRALLAVPGHFIYAVVMGFFYAKASFDDQSRMKRNLALAICIPILIHTIDDSLLMVSDLMESNNSIYLSDVLFFIVWVPFYIYLIVKSKRLGKNHLAMDKEIKDNNDITTA